MAGEQVGGLVLDRNGVADAVARATVVVRSGFTHLDARLLQVISGGSD
jgi:hypothetical protein